MIQRIQSVYLLVVTILIIICLCSPVGSYIGSDYSVSALTNLCLTMADGTKDYAPWALFVILLVVAVLAFGTIFLFKKRMLQIRLTIFSTILLIGYYATLVTFIFMLKEESMTFSPSWMVCCSLVAIILNWLAIRAIGKDEVLVKQLPFEIAEGIIMYDIKSLQDSSCRLLYYERESFFYLVISIR